MTENPPGIYKGTIFDDKSRFYSFNHDINVTNITNL